MRGFTLLVLVLALPVLAISKPVNATDASQVSAVLSEQGYTFTLDQDDEGMPLFRIKLKAGYDALLFFYDDIPDRPGYESLQLYAAFGTDSKVPLQKVNNWNYSYRFAKVYLDDDLDPVLESDLDLSGGVDLAGTLAVFLENFETSFKSFASEVVGR